MDENTKIELLGKLVGPKDLPALIKERKNPHITATIPPRQLEQYEEDGWEIDREFKTKIRVRRPKTLDVMFEDKVWALFAQMGFTFLNRDRQFRLPYSKDNPELRQQIDVFAKDDETILLVECKTADSSKRGQFKKELEAASGNIKGLFNSARTLFPTVKHKMKFILATHNLGISEEDELRLRSFGGLHLDEDNIDYFTQLFGQLGGASKYQLLGNIFADQEIPEIENRIPAVEGKMGGHKYYSFALEPDKLLKIGYVLHRNRANVAMMPTYQRLIKKARLKGVREFVDAGGYFPNSIVINIDGPLTFEPAKSQVEGTESRAGILHLPKKYRSAFIIDGQHRLYGYAGSKWAESNTIPVVAFNKLSREDQIKLFMQINENQKAVSKDLRNTLNADLLWTSKNYLEQFKALCSRTAIFLGEDRTSPLYNRISIGEDKKTITTQAIQNALRRGTFLGNVTATKIVELGTLYNGNLDDTYEKLRRLLNLSFQYMSENVADEWERGESGMLVINKGVYGLLMVFSDIVKHVRDNTSVDTGRAQPKEIFEEVKTYLDALILFLKELDEESKTELKSSYGSTGETKYWRTFQKAIHEVYPAFEPVGMAEWFKREEKQFNERAFQIIRDIETFFKDDFRERLEEFYGRKWFERGVPPKFGERAVTEALAKNRDIDDEEREVEPWDCLTIIAYREIAMKNWQNIFEKEYTRPGEEKRNVNKEEKTSWMQSLERIRNQNFHSYSVTEEELEFLESLHDWLITKTLRNKFQVEETLA